MAQYVVNWILLGCFYAAIGLGFSLIWGIMNIVNLAQGSLVILGAYVPIGRTRSLHLNPFLGILVAMVVLFLYRLRHPVWHHQSRDSCAFSGDVHARPSGWIF